jgi:hypothetical protein
MQRRCQRCNAAVAAALCGVCLSCEILISTEKMDVRFFTITDLHNHQEPMAPEPTFEPGIQVVSTASVTSVMSFLSWTSIPSTVASTVPLFWIVPPST